MSKLILAAEYLRVSTEQQKYSLESQRRSIRAFGELRGFQIVRSYVDVGKSGLNIRGRPGLKELIRDVLSADVEYSSILVYDVSRWGRFPDIDEAAHYEFLCRRAGIPVLYCAEPDVNSSEECSAILKALRRIMAAEFSRELSGKVFASQKQSAEAGFKLGSCPFGYRRLLVSPDRTPKRVLGPKELKPKTGDKVVLVPGPAKEVACVRAVFALAAEGKRPAELERIATENGWTNEAGKPLLRGAIDYMLKNPVYKGDLVWNRHSTKLHSKMTKNPIEKWVRVPGVVERLVDDHSFAKAQSRPRNRNTSTDFELLEELRQILREEGTLSQGVIKSAWREGKASEPNVYSRRFGGLRNTYQLIGYIPSSSTKGVAGWKTIQFRDQFIRSIVELAPDHFSVFVLPGRTRFLLQVDHEVSVSVRICYRCRERGIPTWRLNPTVIENQYAALFVLMNQEGTDVESCYLLAAVNSTCVRDFDLETRWFKPGVRVESPYMLYACLTSLIRNGWR